jgi:hypothetical protein
MVKNLKRFFGFALFLAIFIVSFYGINNSETINNALLNETNLADTITLNAHPGPLNNGGSPGWAMFFDVIAGAQDVSLTQMSTGNTGTAAASFSVEVFTRSGTGLGGPVGSGPGSSSAGWTSLGIVPVIQGPTASGVSEIFTIPTILVSAFDTVGIAVKFTGFGPRYTGTGSGPVNVYSDSNITLKTGDGRSAPFTPTGSFFSSRALTGVLRYVVNTVSGTINLGSETPNSFKLSQNYPNPFNPATKIKFDIIKSANGIQNSLVTLKVFDITGREVATLVNQTLQAGTYEVTFDAASLNSGVYYYRLTTDGYSDTKKMILLK